MTKMHYDYSILFVCLGNICRSPAAEAVMATVLRRRGLSRRIFTDSAGTADYHVGRKSDERMIAAGTRRAHDFTHRARQIDPADLEDFDLILAMDTANLRNIHSLTSDNNLQQKISLFLPYSGFADLVDVPDPYYGGPEGFEHVMDLMEEGCERLANKITEIIGRPLDPATLA